jgi:hypothetical protein
VEKPTPKKKKERAKAVKKIAKLEQPMSVLTRDSVIPVADIDAYVNRSLETRRKEVDEGKIPGKVKRPMNAFMLYRKAYQNRAKEWCSHHNHQVVSQVCGDSWPLEPEHIREQFTEWARVERDNHREAHPGYKFTPSKPMKARYQGEKEMPDTDASDGDDPEWRSGSNRQRKRSQPKTQQQPREQKKPDSLNLQAPQTLYQHLQPQQNQPFYHANINIPTALLPVQNRSTFQYGSQGKEAHEAPDGKDVPEHYLQMIQVRQPLNGVVEDMMVHKTPGPAGLGAAVYAPVDPFGAVVTNLAASRDAAISLNEQRLAPPHQRIDPSLLPVAELGQWDPMLGSGFMVDGRMAADFDGQLLGWPSASYVIDDGSVNAFGFVGADAALMSLEQSLMQEQQQNQILKGTEQSWQVEELDPGSQFDNWMEPHRLDRPDQ